MNHLSMSYYGQLSSSRNGGRRVAYTLSTVFDILRLAKSTNCKSLVILCNGASYWDMFQNKRKKKIVEVKVIVQGQNCFLSDTPMVIVCSCVKFQEQSDRWFWRNRENKIRQNLWLTITILILDHLKSSMTLREGCSRCRYAFFWQRKVKKVVQNINRTCLWHWYFKEQTLRCR